MTRSERDHPAAPRAVIDIGSNTVRLVVYGGPPRAPAILHNEKVTARLGKGVAENGQLSDKAQAAALAALARFRVLLDLAGVHTVEAVATAAARDAANGPQFLDRVRELGFPVRLLSGEEEALTSAAGVTWAFPGACGIVADLGGGSLELTDIADGACTHGTSLPLGTLRLPALREKGPKAVRERLKALLDKADWHAAPGQDLYLVGGSLRAFARYAMVRQDWPIDDPHGYALEADAAIGCARAALRKAPDLSLSLPGISASRVASLPDAAALLAALIGELAPARLVFSSWGLREGVLFAGASPALARLDPLLAGVSAFAEGSGVTPATATMIAGWTLAANAPDAPGAEPLRLAATLLALASARIEPNLRPGTVLDWALRKRWIGIDAEDRAVLAAALLANAGRGEEAAVLTRLAPALRLEEARGWGLAIRLARRFSGSSPQVLAGSSLSLGDGDLVLSVNADCAPLVTDPVERDLKTLAIHLGRKAVVLRS